MPLRTMILPEARRETNTAHIWPRKRASLAIRRSESIWPSSPVNRLPRPHDAQYPDDLRPVRARDHRRTHSRQGRRRQAAGGGKYCGGVPILSYDVDQEKKRLLVSPEEAKLVQFIFRRFIQLGSAKRQTHELNEQGYHTKAWTKRKKQGTRRRTMEHGLCLPGARQPDLSGRGHPQGSQLPRRARSNYRARRVGQGACDPGNTDQRAQVGQQSFADHPARFGALSSVNPARRLERCADWSMRHCDRTILPTKASPGQDQRAVHQPACAERASWPAGPVARPGYGLPPSPQGPTARLALCHRFRL